MDQGGVVPFSHELIPSITDSEGNLLYTLVCVKTQAADYIKVLKKNGYTSQ